MKIFCIESWTGWCKKVPKDCPKAWSDVMLTEMTKAWHDKGGQGDPPLTFESQHECWEQQKATHGMASPNPK